MYLVSDKLIFHCIQHLTKSLSTLNSWIKPLADGLQIIDMTDFFEVV